MCLLLALFKCLLACCEIGLYQISAPALAENRQIFQIRLQPKCSWISFFGGICKMAHPNIAMFCISSSFEKMHNRCLHIFDLFVYCVEISP